MKCVLVVCLCIGVDCVNVIFGIKYDEYYFINVYFYVFSDVVSLGSLVVGEDFIDDYCFSGLCISYFWNLFCCIDLFIVVD